MTDIGKSPSTIEHLADYVFQINFDDLPAEVVTETKRLILDSISCALAGTASDKGKWGLAFARQFYPNLPQSTLIGFGDKMSAIGAAFVNGELINALDYDAIMPPGHVSPFVIPAILAVAEMEGVSGKELITACALAHEISHRIGGALAYYRDIVKGRVVWPPVSGYSCCVFGGTAGVGKIKKFTASRLSHALGMAGHIAPMQAMTSWAKSRRATTAKYLLAGWISQAEITAALLVELGHRGDIFILDGDYGFWRYAGSTKWEPASVVDDLGKIWRFPAVTSYKPFPACRIFAGSLDCLSSIVEKEALRPEEIENIKAYAESNILEPLFQEREVNNHTDAQFRLAYNLSLVAHRIKPGPQWQSYSTLNDHKILKFMDKITYQPHPEFLKALKEDPRSRIAKVEVIARGKTFTEERRYPKGSPSPDKDTYMTDAELVNKFKDNASHILPSNKIDEAVNGVLRLEHMADIREMIDFISV